ncbi:tyrosine-type recombinase/integrase [Pantoea coffeiphila]|uniref:Integrase n=1 Tax=Pantoea coffeiphila TaxID=1465635 RepID=A0A2S9I897_9GAMM|nr:tyrosine-type recombinase/integrase [Pantoea coffeiphila]PRD14022.1 integrase [Pantoea coffeiphila]
MARRPTNYDKSLPRNLTYRHKYRAYYWRNPTTGVEISMGRITRRDAIAQAIEANSYIEQNYSPVLLLERLKNTPEADCTLEEWNKRFLTLIERRVLKPKTIIKRKNQIKRINKEMGKLKISQITTPVIAAYLEIFIVEEKTTAAADMRSVLVDIFNTAISEGVVKLNPVTPTKTPRIIVKRSRLLLDEFFLIREAATANMPAWFPIAMDLALVTGQRREDVARMRFNDIVEGRLLVEQSKYGSRVSIPLSLRNEATGLVLSDVIARCKAIRRNDYLLCGKRLSSARDGSLHPDTLTNAFADAKNLTPLVAMENPPSFHEIRSLAGRLYSKERGKEFAQKLLGHKNVEQTDEYLDGRGREYTII